MRTSETLLLDFIRQSPQFRIPVNQRRFAWTQRECRQLWEDILDAGERADVREHFLGPGMYRAAVDPLEEAGPETLAGDLRTCADHYRAIVLGEEPDPELVQAFRELARLDMKPVWPFLLHLYGDYAGGRLSRHDLVALTRLVAAYTMRRAVCGYKPAALPPVFARAVDRRDCSTPIGLTSC